MSVAHNIEEKVRTDDVHITETVNFTGLLLSPPVLEGLTKSGFKRPSPIQLHAIPLGRCGLDLIVQAKSGTGKTCVFTVIALEGLNLNTDALQVLILAPTREIAIQIKEVVRSIGSCMPELKCHSFIGGTSVQQDKVWLKQCHIATGTPGRIKQLIELGVLKTQSIRLFVMDEADKLLDGALKEPINWIYSSLPDNKQILALSATYPETLAQHLTRYMRNPTFVRLNITDPALIGIKQFHVIVPDSPLPNKVFEAKTEEVVKILSSVSFEQCLIFSNLQTRAQSLQSELESRKWPTQCIAGCLDQKDRSLAMEDLKAYKCRILISTDLTSRGIDADKVNMVINLDVPLDHETYLHRIGRAGRFGSHGAAISIVSKGRQEKELWAVERKCKTNIPKLPDPIPRDLATRPVVLKLSDVITTKKIITQNGSNHQLPFGGGGESSNNDFCGAGSGNGESATNDIYGGSENTISDICACDEEEEEGNKLSQTVYSNSEIELFNGGSRELLSTCEGKVLEEKDSRESCPGRNEWDTASNPDKECQLLDQMHFEMMRKRKEKKEKIAELKRKATRNCDENEESQIRFSERIKDGCVSFCRHKTLEADGNMNGEKGNQSNDVGSQSCSICQEESAANVFGEVPDVIGVERQKVEHSLTTRSIQNDDDALPSNLDSLENSDVGIDKRLDYDGIQKLHCPNKEEKAEYSCDTKKTNAGQGDISTVYPNEESKTECCEAKPANGLDSGMHLINSVPIDESLECVGDGSAVQLVDKTLPKDKTVGVFVNGVDCEAAGGDCVTDEKSSQLQPCIVDKQTSAQRSQNAHKHRKPRHPRPFALSAFLRGLNEPSTDVDNDNNDFEDSHAGTREQKELPEFEDSLKSSEIDCAMGGEHGSNLVKQTDIVCCTLAVDATVPLCKDLSEQFDLSRNNSEVYGDVQSNNAQNEAVEGEKNSEVACSGSFDETELQPVGYNNEGFVPFYQGFSLLFPAETISKSFSELRKDLESFRLNPCKLNFKDIPDSIMSRFSNVKSHPDISKGEIDLVNKEGLKVMEAKREIKDMIEQARLERISNPEIVKEFLTKVLSKPTETHSNPKPVSGQGKNKAKKGSRKDRFSDAQNWRDKSCDDFDWRSKKKDQQDSMEMAKRGLDNGKKDFDEMLRERLELKGKKDRVNTYNNDNVVSESENLKDLNVGGINVIDKAQAAPGEENIPCNELNEEDARFGSLDEPSGAKGSKNGAPTRSVCSNPDKECQMLDQMHLQMLRKRKERKERMSELKRKADSKSVEDGNTNVTSQEVAPLSMEVTSDMKTSVVSNEVKPVEINNEKVGLINSEIVFPEKNDVNPLLSVSCSTGTGSVVDKASSSFELKSCEELSKKTLTKDDQDNKAEKLPEHVTTYKYMELDCCITGAKSPTSKTQLLKTRCDVMNFEVVGLDLSSESDDLEVTLSSTNTSVSSCDNMPKSAARRLGFEDEVGDVSKSSLSATKEKKSVNKTLGRNLLETNHCESEATNLLSSKPPRNSKHCSSKSVEIERLRSLQGKGKISAAVKNINLKYQDKFSRKCAQQKLLKLNLSNNRSLRERTSHESLYCNSNNQIKSMHDMSVSSMLSSSSSCDDSFSEEEKHKNSTTISKDKNYDKKKRNKYFHHHRHHHHNPHPTIRTTSVSLDEDIDNGKRTDPMSFPYHHWWPHWLSAYNNHYHFVTNPQWTSSYAPPPYTHPYPYHHNYNYNPGPSTQYHPWQYAQYYYQYYHNYYHGIHAETAAACQKEYIRYMTRVMKEMNHRFGGGGSECGDSEG